METTERPWLLIKVKRTGPAVFPPFAAGAPNSIKDPAWSGSLNRANIGAEKSPIWPNKPDHVGAVPTSDTTQADIKSAG